MDKSGIRVLIFLCSAAIILVAYAVIQNGEIDRKIKTGEMYADSAPKYEWTNLPRQSLGLPPTGSRSLTWEHFAEGTKARFSFVSSTPINVSVIQMAETICSAPFMLRSTLECTLHDGPATLIFSDPRTTAEITVEGGLGLYVRDRNAVTQISPSTIDLDAAFFACVRNCPRTPPPPPVRQQDCRYGEYGDPPKCIER